MTTPTDDEHRERDAIARRLGEAGFAALLDEGGEPGRAVMLR